MAADWGCEEIPLDVIDGLFQLCCGHRALVNQVGALMLSDIRKGNKAQVASVRTMEDWRNQYLASLRTTLIRQPVFQRIRSSLEGISITLACNVIDEMKQMQDPEERDDLVESADYLNLCRKLSAAGLLVYNNTH